MMRGTGRRAGRGTHRPFPARPRAPRASRPEPYDRGTVLARWSGCCYCAGPAEEIDHVHPIVLGGQDVESNVVGVCARCNREKAGRSLADWASTF